MKSAEKPQKTEPPPQDSFKPFDYSQSDLKVFAGMCIYGILFHHIGEIITTLHLVTVVQLYVIKMYLN